MSNPTTSALLVLALGACRPAGASAPPVVTGPAAVASVSLPVGTEAPPDRDTAPGVEPLLLRNGRLVDGTGAAPRDDVDVLIRDGVITEVGKDLLVTEPVREIDLQGRTLLPGLIDAHVHLTFSPAVSYAHGVVGDVTKSDADRALEGAHNARATLHAGFTTVRNVGGGLADRALRDAIRRGDVVGPRMLVANHAIGITGGHCDDTNVMHPDIFPDRQDYRSGVADGPEEVRKAVRWQVKHGADVIKICATGGVMSQGDAVGASQMTREEIEAAVTEAGRAERRVAAHAHGTEGIREAILGGVHSVEHGSILDRETVGLLSKHGTFLVPTVYVARAVEERADAGVLSPESAAKARMIAPKMRKSFKMAYDAGVKIALGSDAGVFEHGDNGKELTTMVALGMKEMDALVAATSRAAELLGVDNVGRIAPGALGDVVVVDGDPLTDIELVEHPALVVKGGVVHVEPQW
jgi:imidazolonepropionase-like amidohydrolase